MRKISVVVDNDSWILPYAELLVKEVSRLGLGYAVLVRSYDLIETGDVAFFLGCLGLVKESVRARNRVNLVVHASDLPSGRGMSPWTWAVLEGADSIPVCLLFAEDKVDSGDIVYKRWYPLEGTELVDDLRAIIGQATVELSLQYLAEATPPEGRPQEGEPSYYSRRTADDSQLDVDKTLAEQFDLLRVVDNKAYPAFFRYKGKRYNLLIEHVDED